MARRLPAGCLELLEQLVCRLEPAGDVGVVGVLRDAPDRDQHGLDHPRREQVGQEVRLLRLEGRDLDVAPDRRGRGLEHVRAAAEDRLEHGRQIQRHRGVRHVAEVDDAAHPVPVEQEVVEGQVVVDDLGPQGREGRRHPTVVALECRVDQGSTGRIGHRLQVRPEEIEVLEVPQDHPARGRMEEAAQRPPQASGDPPDLGEGLRPQARRVDVAAGQERDEPDEVLATGPTGDANDGVSVLGRPRHGDRQGRIHAGHVAHGLDLHVDHGRVLDRVRDLQDPGDAIAIGQPKVLVPLADQRLRAAADAKEGVGERSRLLHGEGRGV